MTVLFRLMGIHFKEIYRSPEILFWVVFFPSLLTIGLGYAFNQKNEETISFAVAKENILEERGFKPLAPLDQDGLLVERWEKKTSDSTAGKLRFVGYIASQESDEKILLKRGMVQLLVKGEKDFAYHYDLRNQNAKLAFYLVRPLLEQSKAEDDNRIVSLLVPGTRYVDYLIPGLISMNLMMSCLWGVGYALIEKRSRRLLRRLIATPMRKWQFLLSLIAIRWLFGLLNVSILLTVSYFVFDFKLVGSLFAFLLIYTGAFFAFGGFAILLGSRTSNPETGSGLINSFTSPMVIICGVFFSYQNFPDWIAPPLKFLPLSLVTDALRLIALEGVTWGFLSWRLLVLGIFGVATLILGNKIFKWN